MTYLRALLLVGFQNLVRRRSSVLIGGLLVAGTFALVVVGGIRRELHAATRDTLVNSFVGHLHLFASDSSGERAVFGLGGGKQHRPIRRFDELRSRLLALPNVRAVLPVSVGSAGYLGGNAVDRACERLRELERRLGSRNAEAWRTDAEAGRQIGLGKHLSALLLEDLEASKALLQPAEYEAQRADLLRAASPGFWEELRADPLPALEFLENRIAPLLHDDSGFALSYLGTRFAQLYQDMPSVQVIEGERVPPGERGMLMSKKVYEDRFKLKFARRLDKVREALARGQTLAEETQLRQLLRQNQLSGRDVLLELDEQGTAELALRLRKALGSTEADPARLLSALAETDDAHFAERYALFYKEVAPLLNLYSVPVGGSLTLRGSGATGTPRWAKVKLWGIYTLAGLEQRESPAADSSLIDHRTFTNLLGMQSEDDKAEAEQLSAAAGLEVLSREQVEAQLFGGQAPLDVRPAGPSRATLPLLTREEVANGVVLNAAVWLKDPSLQDRTAAEIQALSHREWLWISVLSWRNAAGLMGDVASAAQFILSAMLIVLFVIVGILLNSTTVLSALQRIREFGALRAIGATKSFIFMMVLCEAVVAVLLFGTLGAALGSLLLWKLGSDGIPAPNADLSFFFGGLFLRPRLSLVAVASALGTVLAVTAGAALYPAALATRVAPEQAMRDEE
jgi:ABC-type lipoprotein release transport system permease subunit